MQEETEHKSMREFKTYHPIVNFIYFLFVIGFSMFFMHPVCLAVSFFCGFTHSVLQGGRRALKTTLFAVLPVCLCTALINPLFNHAGATILAYFPGGNPLTLESILYGLAAASMLSCVLFHFSCYNAVMTSDKFIYLFGRVMPSLSLILSMTLRFVPRFSAQLRVVQNARKCIGYSGEGNLIQKIKHGLSVLSAMVSWALENAAETADSMKARGYGLPGRTAFSVFTLDRRDKTALFCILGLGLYVLGGSLAGGVTFRYFPTVGGAPPFPFRTSIFTAYFALCMIPILIEIREAIKWKAIQSKI